MQSNARADAAQIERPARWAIILGLAGLATLILVLADARPGSALPLKGTRITTTRTKLGTILADARGRTLYLFEKDKRGLSLCTGSCESYWPPVLTKGAPLASGGVKTPLLGTVKRSDGGLQVTYAGHPLYTFKLDTSRGQAKGEGTNFFGGEWYALATSGSRLEQQAAAAAGSPSSAANTGGGGYGY